MHRFNDLGHIHFVTANTHGRQKFFTDDKCCRLFLDNLDYYRKKFNLKIYGYCIMPDHVHLLVYFENPKLTISRIMHGVKGYSSRLINEYLFDSMSGRQDPPISFIGRQGSYALPLKSQGAGALATRRMRRIWQPSFYDFNIYSGKKFNEKLNYIHNNPISARLVEDISKYPYSSWRNYEIGDQSIFKTDFIEY
ncbi:MAG: transposase [Patescibacteria group bacterium]|nr:transposase [Patescibacteria group bacterium]